MSVSEFFRKTFAHQESRVRQAGQAVVEYILVLVITVAIILGIMSQFSDAFKQFLDSYFGDYIACLLETGELPAFGGSGLASEECNSKFQTFSIANGRPRIKSSNGGSGGNAGSGKGSGDGSGDSADSSGSRDKNNKLRPTNFNNGGGSGNGESSTLAARLSPSSQRLDATGKNSPSGKSSSGSGSDSSDGFGGRQGKGRRYRTRTIILGEEYLSEDAKQKEKKTITRSVKSKEQKRKESLRAAQFELKVPEKRNVASEEDESSFSLGTLLKILLIAGIIIAIFIFLGGQAMQIKKSWQKTE